MANVFFLAGCSGYEPRIELCQWNRRKMGSGVCDLHPNLGLRCLPFHHEESRLVSPGVHLLKK